MTSRRRISCDGMRGMRIGCHENVNKQMAAANVSIVQKYQDVCNEIEVGPISRVVKELETGEINLLHHGLGLKETQALAKVLPLARTERLILKDNYLSSECITAISQAIIELPTLTILDMSDNKVCPTGGASIAAMLKDNMHLRTLNLAS